MVLRLFFIAFLLLLGCGDLSFENNLTDPRNVSHPDSIAYESFTDARDGKAYKSVVIGSQTWMAENLNFKIDGSSYCAYNIKRNGEIIDTLVSDGGYCDIYGRVYDGYTAMSVCPSGWHLPSNNELGILYNFVGDETYLYSTTDTYGFTLLPGGSGYYSDFSGVGEYSELCTTGSYYSKCYVRCVKDYVCGSTPFNSETQFCNNNIIYNKCNSQTYDPANQRCGAGNVIEVRCGSGWYNPATQRCGTDNVIEVRCGSGWYNAAVKFCLNNVSYDLCGGKTYEPATQRCGTGNIIETKCGTGWYNNLTQFCSNNAPYDLCGGKTYDPAKQQCGAGNAIETKCGTVIYDASNTNLRCSNNVVQTKCGSTLWYDASTQFCYTNNIYSKCNGNNYDPLTQYCYEATMAKDYDFMIDSRDSKTYKTIEIGSQVWMAENLNYNTTNSLCHGDKTGGDSRGNCAIYGRLYDWETARTVCPEDWHLPSDAEWGALMQYLDPSCSLTEDCYTGRLLKANNGWNDNENKTSGNGTNAYGFSGLPGGAYYYWGASYNNSFSSIGVSAYFWSSSSYSSSQAYIRVLDRGGLVIYTRTSTSDRNSVRCLHD